VHYLDKFCADRSNRCGETVYSFFQDCGRPPSWICCTPAWATHEAQLVVSIRVIVLKMRFLMSCEFGLQMPIHAPLFFGGKMGKTETVCSFITLAMCVL